jgi:molecular chaperone DnaK
MKSANEALTQASHKLSEEIYKNTSQQAPGQEPPVGAKPEEGVVDADFEEVK